jgi:protein DGCR14
MTSVASSVIPTSELKRKVDTPDLQIQVGSNANTQQLAIFKAPTTPVRKRKKQKVLDEETWVESLSTIIQRDFFPDLEKLRLQQEILEAREANDLHRLQELELRARLLTSTRRKTTDYRETPREDAASAFGSATPSLSTSLGDNAANSSFEASTPVGKDVEEGGSRGGEKKQGTQGIQKVNGVNVSMSLDSFLSNHTSEDNSSFDTILDGMNERRREKYKWLYEQEEKQRQALQKQMLLLTDGSEAGPGGAKSGGGGGGGAPACLTGGTYVVKNALMYSPEGVPLTPVEEEQLAKAQMKQINHANTRIKKPPAAKPVAAESTEQTVTWGMLEAGERELIEQRRALREGPKSFDLDELRGFASPKVNGYGFMVTPSPRPNDSPFMTWGKVESTPLIMNELNDLATPIDTTPGPSFKLPEPKEREKVALQLAEKASKEIRKKKKLAEGGGARHTLATPSASPLRSPLTLRRVGTPSGQTGTVGQSPLLSPAGQKLVEAAIAKRKGVLASDQQLRASYSSPSPRLVRSGARTPTSSSSGSAATVAGTSRGQPLASPIRVERPAARTPSSSSSYSLTDNLLNI